MPSSTTTWCFSLPDGRGGAVLRHILVVVVVVVVVGGDGAEY